jgi:hypothetical protein
MLAYHFNGDDIVGIVKPIEKHLSVGGAKLQKLSR